MPPTDRALSKYEVRAALQRACAIAHGRGAHMPLLQLCVLVMRDGLPPEAEREKMLARKLAEAMSE